MNRAARSSPPLAARTPLVYALAVPSSSLEAALAAQDWADLSRRLTRYAFLRLRKSSWANAEEIAQQAITQLLDPAYASWDRERHPDLFDCVGHIVNGLVANHFRARARRGAHVSLRDDDEAHDDEIAPLGRDEAHAEHSEDRRVAAGPPTDAVVLADARTPEGLLEDAHAAREARRDEAAMAALRARLAGDSLCLALLDRMKDGSARAAADAEALGVPVSDVYSARRRLLYHSRGVARDLAAGGESS